MNNIKAGQLRHRVEWFRLLPPTPNSSGDAIPTSASQGTFYALVEAVAADEVINADQRKGLRSYKVSMRNVGAFRPTDYLTWNGINLNVQGSWVDPFGIFTTLDCTELIVNQ